MPRLIGLTVALCLIPALARGQVHPGLAKHLRNAVRTYDPNYVRPTERYSFFELIKQLVVDRVSIEGYRNIGYHTFSLEGDREAFSVQNYSGLGGKTFTDTGFISLRGSQVLGAINFSAVIQDGRFRDPQNDKFSIDIRRGGATINLGDINGSLLNSNRFASFNRTLRGAQIGFRRGALDIRAVTSEARGQARTVTIVGNNSAGPYYLQASQIVAESETVQVDGITMRRGIDYSISYEIGAITFLSRSIPPSSSIVVTFEAYAANTRLGTVQGIGGTYDFGKFGKLGLTHLQQKVAGGSFGSTRTELFQGFGPPSVPYTLQFEPLPSRPITIRIDGVLQVQGVDFVFDSENPAIFYFNRFVPFTSEVDVTYTPRPTSTVDGDREVSGIDFLLPLGKGSIKADFAYGKLRSDINPSNGTARSLEYNYDDGKLNLYGRNRDVSPGYVSIETRSFNRNEKATDFGIFLRPSKDVKTGISTQNSYVTTRRTNDQGQTIYDPSRVTGITASYDLTPEDGRMPLHIEALRSKSRLNTNESNVDQLRIGTSRKLSNGTWRIGVSHLTGSAPKTFEQSAERIGFSILGLDSSLTLSLLKNLVFDGQLSLNSTRADGESSTGLRNDLALTYSNARLTVSAVHSRIDAGSINSLGGFLGGSGIGLSGSGFSGGDSGISTIGATNSIQSRLSASYSPAERVSIALEAYDYQSSGAVSSDSRTTGIGLVSTLTLGRHRLSLSADSSKTRFLGSNIRSNATTLNGLIEGTFTDRLSYNLRGSALITGGGGQFNQSGGSFEAQIAYLLSPRETLSAQWVGGNTRGYLPQIDITSGVNYAYRIWRPVTLNVGYRFRDVRNQDPTITSGAYRYSGLDISLNFTFGR